MLFWFGILPALFWQFLLALIYLLWVPTGQTQLAYGIAKLLLVIWPLLWWTGLHRQLPSHVSLRRTSLWYGLVTGIIIVLTVGLVSWLSTDFFLNFRTALQAQVADFGLNQTTYLWFALGLAIVHAGFEEWYWRSFVFRGLRLKLNWSAAALVSSLAFASHHIIVLMQFAPPWFSVMGGLAVGLAGYVWCYQYQKTGSLFGSWVSHLLADLVVMAVGYWILFL